VGSAAAHRRKRQRSRGPTHHVRQAEVIEVVSLILAYWRIGVLAYWRIGDSLTNENTFKPHGLGTIF
jgi:hypothetical protein